MLFYFDHISYYRLKGYWWDMQDNFKAHHFKEGSYFEDVIDRYNFDRKLRLILFDAVEIIEIALRTKLIYHLSQEYGGLWYLDDSLVKNKSLHAKHLKDLREEFNRSREIFAKDFNEKHPKEDPDAWIIFEVATFGTLSKMYKNLKDQMPKKSIIANEMGLSLHNDLSSWLEAISYIRNIVAHHSRLWSRNMVKRPALPHNPKQQWLNNQVTESQKKKPFLIITAMMYLCDAICPNHKIKKRLLNLLQQNKNIPIYKIGFLDDWQTDTFWQ